MYKFNTDDAYRFAREIGAITNTRGSELTFRKCPYCGADASQDHNKFSINLKNGQFNCFRASCGARGNMITLAKDFNFSLGNEVDEYYRPQRHYKRILKKAEDIVVRDPAVEYMASRGISREIVERYHITMTEDGKSIVMPFQDEYGDIQFIKYRNPKPKKNQSKEYSEKDCKPILYGMYQCNKENKTLVITEGQMDSLSLAEAGIENAVSVPTGANGFTWVPYCWAWMEQFDKIIVFGDCEKGKITLYEDMVSRWGNKVWHVQKSDYKDCKDANEILQKYGAEQLRNCVNKAVRPPLKRVIPLSEVKKVDPEDVEKCMTGLKDVDRLLNGGLPFGQVVLITGKAGEGKSTFASQVILSAIDQGFKTFAYSGELPNFVFRNWMVAQAAGCKEENTMTFDYATTVYLDESQKPRKVKPEVEDKICKWFEDSIWIYDNDLMVDDEEEESLAALVEEVINQYGVRVILLDNLMTGMDLDHSDGFDKYDRQSAFMKKLTRIAMKYKVLIILVAHMRKNNFSSNTNDNISGSADIGNLVSVVISYEKSKDSNTDNSRLLKITKNRLYGKLNTEGFKVRYDDTSKRVYIDEDELNNDYSWDLPFEDTEPDSYEPPF